MKVTSAVAYGSFFFVAFRLFKKITEARVRVKTIVVKKDYLKGLLSQKEFSALLFCHEYDNKILAKDRVTLLAYVSDTDKNTTPVPPDQIQLLDADGEPFSNELDYSAYRLERDDIQKVLDSGTGPMVVAFLFQPVLFKDNPKYLAYKIIPADKFNGPVRKPKVILKKAMAMADAMIAEEGFPEDLEEDFGSRGELTMNPSPPAHTRLTDDATS